MKQLLQNMKNGRTSVEEVPVPSPQYGQALVKVSASLVSAGTERMLVEFAGKSLVGKARARPDLARQVLEKVRREGAFTALGAAFNRLDQPIPLGYSTAGTIVALGPGGMEGFKVGQRVACAGGNYAVHADYNLIPRRLLTPLPDGLDFESAAFTTLGAIALHGFRLTEPQLGESVAVVGLGLLGLLTGEIAVASGCRVLGIDLDPRRVDLAGSLGIQAVLRLRAVDAGREYTSNRGFDHVIICADTSSNDPVELAAEIARDRASVVATGAVGLSLPRKPYYEKELSFINSRSYGPGRYDHLYEEQDQDYPLGYVRWTEGRNFEAVVDLMAHGSLKVTPLISHRYPIEQASKAYELITGKTKEPFLGVLLTYGAEETTAPAARITYITRQGQHAAQPGTVTLGVLGAGLYANATLLPAIKELPLIRRVGIASAGGLHAGITARKFGFSYATSEADEILNDPDINTVAILTRHDLHADLVLKALQAGKNVFVEKPLAITPQQLDEVARVLAAGPDTCLTVGFNRRFSPLAKRMVAFINPSLSAPESVRREPLFMHYRVNAGYIPPNHWTQEAAQGGGRIIGEGCHFIDFLTFLTGCVPLSVIAAALPDNGHYCEDNVSMTFAFPDGSVGVVDYLANGDKSFQKERLEVFSAGRIAVLTDFHTLELVHDGRRSTIKKPQDKGWKEEWSAFSNSILSVGEPPIPYEQLVGVTRATFAAIESLRSGEKAAVSAGAGS